MKTDFNYGLKHYFLRSILLNLPLHTIFFWPERVMIESTLFILNELNKQTKNIVYHLQTILQTLHLT